MTIENCAAYRRDRVRRAARVLHERPWVVAADVLDPDEGQRDAWSLEVVVRADDGVPCAALGALAAEDLSVPMVQRQGPDHYVLLAVA